jgi:hypothetical protein
MLCAQRLASVQHNEQQLARMGTRSLAKANHRDQLRTLFNYTGSVSEISIGRLIIA